MARGLGARSLVWRIYLHSVIFVVLPLVGLLLLPKMLSEPPWKQSFERTGTFILGSVRGAEARSPEELAAELARIKRELRAEIGLFSADGKLLAGTTPAPQPLTAAEVEQLARDGVLVKTSDRVVAVPRMAAGQLVGYGVFTRPAPQNTTLQTLSWTLLIGLLIGGVTSFLLARALTRPLAGLATAASRIGAGDLSARTGLHRKDELGAVARAFDDMAERIGQLLRSQKEMLANVSHELRTPLSRIRVALDIAAEGDAEGARESLGEIALDLVELERLVDDILTTVRLDLESDKATATAPPLRLERVPARGPLDQAASRFEASHPKRQLVREVAADLPDIVADSTLIRRVIDNLLDNAAKYSEAPSPVVLRSRRENGSLVVEVVDRGIGIPEADRASLFTPFFRTDRSRTRKTGGVGLGLALARRIVEAHGGTIKLDSVAGGETTASVRVPIDGPGEGVGAS